MNQNFAKVLISIVVCLSALFVLMVGSPDIIDGIVHMMMATSR